ncbi:hypothetical protein PR048_025138 [Dryococelus australis]|uniref:Uncharacterized protein n=1 Tax=Dryococelus australis TaxID=614101 RepID=A0ABQ9GQF4_9NEOP|nr:hypothetical protein PR048_025138 [Dryococelus australis]
MHLYLPCAPLLCIVHLSLPITILPTMFFVNWEDDSHGECVASCAGATCISEENVAQDKKPIIKEEITFEDNLVCEEVSTGFIFNVTPEEKIEVESRLVARRLDHHIQSSNWEVLHSGNHKLLISCVVMYHLETTAKCETILRQVNQAIPLIPLQTCYKAAWYYMMERKKILVQAVVFMGPPL